MAPSIYILFYTIFNILYILYYTILYLIYYFHYNFATEKG